MTPYTYIGRYQHFRGILYVTILLQLFNLASTVYLPSILQHQRNLFPQALGLKSENGDSRSFKLLVEVYQLPQHHTQEEINIQPNYKHKFRWSSINSQSYNKLDYKTYEVEPMRNGDRINSQILFLCWKTMKELGPSSLN